MPFRLFTAPISPGLRKKKRAELSYADVGTFVHAILERVFSSGMLNEEKFIRR